MDRAGNILSAIFDSQDDVWFFVSPDYTIKFFNKKALENGELLHGKQLKAGDNILDYARDTQNNIDQTLLDNFTEAARGKIIKAEEHVQYNGSAIWTRSKYTPVYEDGILLGISILIEDITGQKQLEQERLKQQEEILVLSGKREEFVNIASHELKTPLTSLKASLQIISKLIEKGAGSQEIKSFLDKSHNSISKLNNLIRSLLDANKINSEALSLEKSFFNLSELIDTCCDHVRMEGKHEIEITGELGLQVNADKEKIDQVVVNLINNAVKYAPGSSKIIIEIEHIDTKAKVSVIDFGPGIPAEKVKNLFKRYYQSENNAIHYSGMGLGLYIAEGIIKQHECEIGVITELGHGCTFWFTIPLR